MGLREKAAKAVKVVKNRFNATRSIKDIEFDIRRTSAELVQKRIEEIVNARISAYIASGGSNVAARIAEVTKIAAEWGEKIKQVDDENLRNRFTAAMNADIDKILDPDKGPKI